MRLGRIMLMQLSINCRIRHSWFCCPVSWRRRIHHVLAERDVIGYNNFASWIIVDMYNIMLMRLQESCKSCSASCYLILSECVNIRNLCSSLAVRTVHWKKRNETLEFAHQQSKLSLCYTLTKQSVETNSCKGPFTLYDFVRHRAANHMQMVCKCDGKNGGRWCDRRCSVCGGIFRNFRHWIHRQWWRRERTVWYRY